jgi:hypothetical protein
MGMIAKWVVVPVLLLVVGFYLLGPRLGRLMPSFYGGSAVEVTPVTAGSSKQAFASPDVTVKSRKKLNPPDVQISAQKRSHRKSRVHAVERDTDKGREPVENYVAPSDSH